ncbi:MAG: tyrosine-type recombinase/integrase [Armatimonadetes bacterium]|nr:tyrosine-type recombinase/integrase [Armatimonadota bacterium]
MKKAKNKDANITQRGNSYRVEIKWRLKDGTPFCRDLQRATIEDARAERDAIYEEYNRLLLNPGVRDGRPDKPMTVDALFTFICERDWSNEQDKHVRHFRRLYGKHVKAVLGRMPVNAVNPGDVNQLLADLAASKVKYKGVERPPSEAFLKYVFSTVSRLFSLGRQHGMTTANPCSVKVKWSKLTEERRLLDLTEKAAESDKEDLDAKVLTDKERKRLLTGVEGTPAHIVLTLMDNLGCRTGEALGLVGKDFNFETKRVRIWRTYENGKYKLTKNKQTRSIPLSKALIDYLQSLQRGPEEAIALNGSGRPLDQKPLSELVVPAVKAAKLPSQVSPYWLRHSYISRKLAEGKNPVDVAKVTGHTVDTLLKNYAWAIPEALNNFVD